MKTLRAFVVTTLVTAGTVAGAVAPAQAAPTIVPCHLNQTVDQLTNYGDIRRNNVIVYVGSAKDSAHFEGIVRQGSGLKFPCETAEVPESNIRTYYWVVFRGKGTFVRKGDGGYRNWAFFGSFDRVSDKKVVFHARG